MLKVIALTKNGTMTEEEYNYVVGVIEREANNPEEYLIAFDKEFDRPATLVETLNDKENNIEMVILVGTNGETPMIDCYHNDSMGMFKSYIETIEGDSCWEALNNHNIF